MLFLLLGICAVITVGNFFGKEVAVVVSNILYVPIPLCLVILSSIVVKRFGMTGDHGKAWLLFLGLAASWFVAEQLWLLYDIVYHTDPFPAEADYLYLLGYMFMFAFLLYYLKPVKDIISKTMIVLAVLLSITLLVPTLNMALTLNQDVEWFKLLVAISYPIADTVVIVPAILGLTIFFRGQVSFLWSAVCLAIVLSVIANTAFLFLSIDNSYYTGHPIDILYLGSYILFSFGVYSHIKIFKNYNHGRIYENADDLR